MASIYDNLCALIDQTNKTLQADDAPELETLEATDLITDAVDLANDIFTDTATYIPAKRLADLEEYNTTMAFNRLMMLYISQREDYYQMAIDNSKQRKDRLKFKKSLVSRYRGIADKVTKKYEV